MGGELQKIALLIVGGSVGTLARYGISVALYAWLRQPVFPYGTLLVNVSGSFVIGLLAELSETSLHVSPALRVALLTGLLGGYTTYSSFSYETYGLIRDGKGWMAFVNVAGSVTLGLAAVWAGVRVARTTGWLG